MTPDGLERLKQDEGLRLKAYPDPITKGAPWTIGYGATGSGVRKDTVWTLEQANANILARVSVLELDLRKQFKFFTKLSPVRQDVLTNIAYNIGLHGLVKWPITLSAIARGDFSQAADDIRTNTVWRKQVGDRTIRCADAMLQDTWIV